MTKIFDCDNHTTRRQMRSPGTCPLPCSREARMDKQGVEAIWLFPTLGVLYEEKLTRDTEALLAEIGGLDAHTQSLYLHDNTRGLTERHC